MHPRNWKWLPKNMNYKSDPLHVTPELKASNDKIIDTLRKEHKLLSNKLSRDVYKTTQDLKRAAKHKRTSMGRFQNHIIEWNDKISSSPLVNTERRKEAKRILKEASEIQDKYSTSINDYHQKKTNCTYSNSRQLTKEDCARESHCYWLDKTIGAKPGPMREKGCHPYNKNRGYWRDIETRKKSKKPQIKNFPLYEPNPTEGEDNAFKEQKSKTKRYVSLVDETKRGYGHRGGKRKTRKKCRKSKKSRKSKKRRNRSRKHR